MPSILRLPTPLGYLRIGVFNDNSTLLPAIDDCPHDINAPVVLCTGTGVRDIKIKLEATNPDLPAKRQVDKCFVVECSLLARQALNLGVKFSCAWEDSYSWSEVSPNSGEHMDALTWSDGETFVTVGTHDGEYLWHRA